MGSSSGTNSSSPSMPNPQGSTVTKYGNATPFNPSWVSFLPDSIGEDGRMPMATGLDQSHLDAIRDAPAPPPLSAQPKNAGTGAGDLRTQFAELMAQYNKDKFRENFMNSALTAMNPGGPRGIRRKGGDFGGYTSSGGGHYA